MRTSFLIFLSLLVSTTIAFAEGKNTNPANRKGMEIFTNSNTFTAKTGEELYKTNCQVCHMPAGQGAKGAGMYPALANNPNLASPEFTAEVVMNGLRGMPAFSSDLTDEQIAAVTNFVVTNFGNTSKTQITVDEVKGMRPKTKVSYE